LSTTYGVVIVYVDTSHGGTSWKYAARQLGRK